MKTYLVTGGAGFVGSHFVRCLHEAEKDALIINVDKLTYSGSMENFKSLKSSQRHIFYRADICRQEILEKLHQRHKPGIVVNFAAESHVDRSIESSGSFIRTNVEGLRVMLDLSLKYGVERFVQISTDEVYGPIDRGSFDEKACLRPRNPYASSKAAGDLLALSYGYTHGLPVVVTRSANNFGENQHSEKLIPKAIGNALNLKKIPIYGDGRQIREWIYVKDHCRALLGLLANFRQGEIYNITSGFELENLELVKMLIRKTAAQIKKDDFRAGKITEGLIEFVEDRKGHDFRYSIKGDKLAKDTGWEPLADFERAIEGTVKWHLKKCRRNGE